ncbi:MAG: glycosyltransferase family 4 protein [bacterium]|nr:glycosyltransferase family 4 protein [bacterium]
MQTVLIVSPYFPPSTLAGVHRARHLAKHLPACGWAPTVLCVDESFHEEALDSGLASLVPDSVDILKVSALSARVSRRFGVGEISLRAWRPLRSALFGLLQTGQVDAVLITGSPFYPMLLAPAVRNRFKVPVILDFQDPWVSAGGAEQPRISKAGVSHRLATWFEPRVLGAADYVTSVSLRQNQGLVERYPWLDASRMAAIPIGGDPDDFDMLRQKPPTNPSVQLDPTKINLSYVGTFLPRAGTLMRELFRGLRALVDRRPGVAAQLQLNFIGTSNQPSGSGDTLVSSIAREEGVAAVVSETPARVPFLEALGLLVNSSGLLLIGSDEPHYTASKIYPALMSGRPYVSLFHADSSAHAILCSAGGGRALCFSDVGHLDGMTTVLSDALEELATRPGSFGKADPDAYRPYTASNVAARYAEVFSGLLESGRA